MRRVLAVIGVGAALAVGGCGGDDEEQQPAGGGTATEETAPSGGESGGATADAGKQQFTTTCGGCHTLEDAGTNGQVGPNLDEAGPSEQEVLTAIEQGPGAMPENLLEGEDAQAVAAYVASAAGGS